LFRVALVLAVRFRQETDVLTFYLKSETVSTGARIQGKDQLWIETAELIIYCCGRDAIESQNWT